MTAPEQFSNEWLEEQWDLMAEWSEEALIEKINRLGEENAFLLAYLSDIGEDSLPEDGQELLLFLGVFIQEIYQKQADNPQASLELSRLQETQKANEELLDLLSEQPDQFERSVSLLLEFHESRILLDFLGEILFEEEEMEDLVEESLWEIWIYLKILIEAMND
ncbi:MAG: hypothetical protein AAF694_16720 [Bacteroidota bacterium]